jgi:thiol-disulfide isomerase/thioredoxin
VVFDRRGGIESVLQGGPPGEAPLRHPIAALQVAGNSWAVEADGAVLVFENGSASEWLSPPLPAPPAAILSGRLLASRTVREFALAPVADDDPLLWTSDAAGGSTHGLGRSQPPRIALLGQLVNAGWVAAGPGADVTFAAALRPEIRRFGPDGKLRWVASWAPGDTLREPRLVADDGSLSPRFEVVQHAVAIGPDDLTYVLASSGESSGPDALLVFDAEGRWIRTARVGADDGIFVGPRGALYVAPSGAVLARVAPPARTPFPSFVLPALASSDTLTSEELRGKLVVVNFWASWCGPCRREMPLLDSLSRARSDVAVVGLNEDVDAGQARRFLVELGVGFPSGSGLGKLRARYHYRGLPYTVVLDRELQVVREIHGFGADLGPVHDALEQARADIP